MNVEKSNRDFGWAISQLKDGAKVSREGWNGKGMFLFLVPGKEGNEIKYRAYVVIKSATGDIVPWVCSQMDMLAEDWGIVDD